MIEILVVRSPDMGDEVTVWRDGYELRPQDADLTVVVVDAGAGYSFEDWRESANAMHHVMVSDAARYAVDEAFFDPPGQQYIDGFRELGTPPMFCPTCGRHGNEEDLCVVGEECPAEDCDGIIEHNWKDE